MNRGRVRAFILGAGEDVPSPPPALEFENALIICADGGGSLARRWGWRPALIMGDLDSLAREDGEFWEEQGVLFQVMPVRKDQTDVELAVDYALEAGAESISLVGAWGSRIDHALGNVELLYRLALLGVPNELITSKQVLTAFTGSCTKAVQPGSYVSLVPLTPVVQGVETRGLAYALQGQDLHKGSTFSISNEALQPEISVSSTAGVLLMVCER